MALPPKLMSLADLTPKQINSVIGLARRLKAISKRVLPSCNPTLREAAWKEALSDPTKLSAPPQSLRNMSIALLFSKRSTRTRLSAETAAQLLGGQAIFLGKEDIQLGVNESARDTARVLSGMVQGIFARVGDHSEIEELAKYSEIPVINALSSLWHPTQVLADLQTLYEEDSFQQDPTPAPSPYSVPYSATPEASESDKPESESIEKPPEKPSNAAAAKHRITQTRRRLRPLTVAYVGDSANVLHDMLVTYPRLGHKLQIASPPDPKYRAPAPVWDKVVRLGCDKSIEWTADPREAVKGADVIVTDTWISMGQEAEYEQRVKDFQGYQVTEALCEGAKRDWRFLHCLPRKSHEVDDEVFYGPRSLVFREADNRKWTIMALFHIVFGGGSFTALPHGRPWSTYRPVPKPQFQSTTEGQQPATLTKGEIEHFNLRINTVFDAVQRIENRNRNRGKAGRNNRKPSANANASTAKNEGKEGGEAAGEATPATASSPSPTSATNPTPSSDSAPSPAPTEDKPST